MKNYLKDAIDWLAQRMISLAIPRAVEMLEDAAGKDASLKALPAPKVPEIELH